MRVADREPVGTVRLPDGTITMFQDAHGSWQRLASHGSTATFHVDYVIGSGAHASGYLTQIGDHLFQSPVAYYTSRAAYDLAPGFEGNSDPDFTRPVREGCVFCHAGAFTAVRGSENRYGDPPFSHLAIGCDRCHGSASAHLAKPAAGNIVNPENLRPVARDSVCEQCHLIGVARVFNPGKHFSDFKPGQPLEDTFTIYRNQLPKGTEASFRVISHSEQLALSACLRGSDHQMWCGTCHNPHAEPTDPVAYYRRKCLACHTTTVFAAGHPQRTSDCIGCHMPRRETNDGGHTAFTDHRIQKRPQQAVFAESAQIAAWREPPAELAKRNLGISSIQVGVEQHSGRQIVDGYRMLTEVQTQFPQDGELFSTIGVALSLGHQYAEAVQAFAMAVHSDPMSSTREASLGQAYLALGDQAAAQLHLEKSVQLDTLNLSATTELLSIYERNGELEKARDLAEQIAALTGSR